MKVECSAEKLKNAASVASRFAQKHASLETLQGILLIAEGKTLTLRATNLECGVEISIDAEVLEHGLAVVPGSMFSSLMSNLPSSVKKATLSLSGSLLVFATEKSSSNIKTLSSEDFPILPSVGGDQKFSLDAQELAKLLRTVAFCSSLSSIKPELQSILLFASEGKMIAVATDSFRLAEKILVFKGDEVPQLLIPVRNAAEMMRILENQRGSVEVYFSENQLSLSAGGTYFTTRLIDGTFPNYQQILPKSFSTEAIVLKEDLSQALKTLAIFADKYAQVTVMIDKKKEVVLSARNPDVGEHTITLPGTISGDPIEMSFNGRYIADSLGSITGESIRLGLSGAGRPLALSGAGDGSFMYIVMPMNR